jgi:polysaccharide export outer membrane protein
MMHKELVHVLPGVGRCVIYLDETMKPIFKLMCALLLTIAMGNVMADDVLLGAGDMLKITVYDNPDLTLETKISEAGFITFPLIGNVSVEGLSTSGAEKKIADMLKKGGFVRKPEVNIIVTTLLSQQVSILGQVNKPGRYPMEGRRSITDMIAVAGGISLDGGETVTVVRSRNGKSVTRTVDILNMVRTGNLADNYDLESNDLVYVERYPRFYIYGEVQRPGVYRLEKNMTLVQALSSGGGITLRGTERNIRIKRRDANGTLQVIQSKNDDLVQPDDVIYIQESIF